VEAGLCASGRRQEVRTYPTFTSGLKALAGWLTASARQILTCLGVILTVIPPGRPAPNWTALARIQARPGLARPDWTLKTRRWAVIS
jgi:hypothetical protein